ncbi:uncharacterized protein DUF3710 [Microbacteriaceae bacterium MWH-Ta3]|nr:uncharacterized protein DUF3710 [Microbacteriaceae bacterium MWH-Ta3]
MSESTMAVKSAPADRAVAGPLDVSESNPAQPFIDLGALKIPPRETMQMRLEIEESTKRVVAVTLELAGSTVQCQVFAAPRSTGLWAEIRGQVAEQLSKQGGTSTEIDGPFGPELAAMVPVADGAPRPVRFVGVDGPKWFLRGVISGPAAEGGVAATDIESVYRSLVVNRGTEPLPPRELLPMRVPQQPGA